MTVWPPNATTPTNRSGSIHDDAAHRNLEAELERPAGPRRARFHLDAVQKAMAFNAETHATHPNPNTAADDFPHVGVERRRDGLLWPISSWVSRRSWVPVDLRSEPVTQRVEMGDEQLKKIARELVDSVSRTASIDWGKKEQVRARIRATIRRLAPPARVSPDKEPAACTRAAVIELVMHQAEPVVQARLDAASGALCSTARACSAVPRIEDDASAYQWRAISVPQMAVNRGEPRFVTVCQLRPSFSR
jgi:hypothetical protein